MLSHLQGSSTFLGALPVANPPTALHLCPLPDPNRLWDAVVDATQHFHAGGEEYCVPTGRRLRPIAILRRPLIFLPRSPPAADHVHPVWPAAQSGPPPRCCRAQPAPSQVRGHPSANQKVLSLHHGQLSAVSIGSPSQSEGIEPFTMVNSPPCQVGVTSPPNNHTPSGYREVAAPVSFRVPVSASF